MGMRLVNNLLMLSAYVIVCNNIYSLSSFVHTAIEVNNVTAGITATAEFMCTVSGVTNGIAYLWRTSRNGVMPEMPFPPQIFKTRPIFRGSTLTISIFTGLEQDFDYVCVVSIDGIRIGSATGTLTSPGKYHRKVFNFVV